MKEIPTTFRKNGFDFKLLIREGDIGLFRKSKLGLKFESFEVVIIQRHETFTVEGNQIEAGEHLPYSEQWGRKGWTYCDRLSAERKFDALNFGALVLRDPIFINAANHSRSPWPPFRLLLINELLPATAPMCVARRKNIIGVGCQQSWRLSDADGIWRV